MASLADLERLPKELMWKVFETVPEAALSLRKSSRALKTHVDDFTVGQSQMAVVNKLTLTDIRLPNSAKPKEQLDMIFDIKDDKLGLFYLHLLLIGKQDFKKEIKTMMDPEDAKADEMFMSRSFFTLQFFLDKEETKQKFTYLKECLGRRFTKVQLDQCYGKDHMEAAEFFIEGKLINQLAFGADRMPEELAKFMIKTVFVYGARNLYLFGKFYTELDTVDLLRQLSMLIHSIQIFQTPRDLPADPNDSPTQNMLMGANRPDWADIILELYSYSVSKVAVQNMVTTKWLTSSGEDKLIDGLTNQMKEAWFIGTCNEREEGYTTDAYKDYDVKVNKPPAPGGNNQSARSKQYLQIVHKTRIAEPPLRDMDIPDEGTAKA